MRNSERGARKLDLPKYSNKTVANKIVAKH